MLRDLLKDNIMEVTFTKKDGSERVMICTLIEEYLPSTSGSSTDYAGLVTVYDLEKQSWRSFREDSVIEHKKLDIKGN